MSESRRRSVVWTQFNYISEIAAECYICEAKLSTKGGSTANLRRHLRTKHPTVVLPDVKQDPAPDTKANTPCRLIDKPYTYSRVWKYFAFEAKDGENVHKNKPTCKQCLRSIQTKGGSTSNLAKHLKDKHPDLFRELKYQCDPVQEKQEESHTPTQPKVTETFERHRKYDSNSNEAKKLNRAVAEFLCMDKVPIYTVEQYGFHQMLEHLNPKYQLPSRNYFINTEIPRIYTETKELITQHLKEKPYYACTADLWTSRTAHTFMSITVQYITNSWEMHSWCLGCSGMDTDHTGENLKEAFEEKIEEWKFDISRMAGITTENATNNKKAFKDDYTWIPCFGHTLHLAVSKAIDIYKVSAALSRLRKTISAFTRSPKLSRQLAKKQRELSVQEHRLIHDEPTQWNSTYDMVERFLEQQQAVCAVLAEDWKNCHLMPKDTDITILETLKDVLGPLSPFTDALSGEQHTTLSSVLPLTWKIFTSLNDEEKDSLLAGEMKTAVRHYLNKRVNDDKQLLLILNSATYLDPRFKDMFVSLKEEVKQFLLDQVEGNAEPNGSRSHVPERGLGKEELVRPHKKQKDDLRRLLSSIQGEKKGCGSGATPSTPGVALSKSDKLKDEFQVYEKMPEISAEEDPLSWWKTNASTLPQLSDFARKYLCIAASSCASERVLSTSGLIASPRRSTLTQENIDMLVFLSKNLELTKKLKNPSEVMPVGIWY